MMLLFLLFLSFLKGSFGFHCAYSDEPKTYSLDEFSNEEFRSYVDTLQSYDYSDDDEKKCRVEIFIDYQSRELTISFGDSFPWSELDYGEGRLDFLIILNNSEADIYNVLEYACYDYDECNKLFVFNHIYWLKQINYTLFQTHLASLLVNDKTTENCFTDKGKSLNCTGGVCSGKYSSYQKKYSYECHQKSEALIEVHITTSMVINEDYIPNENDIEEHQIIRYTCKSNQCNNQLLTDQLINIVNEYFDLSSMKNGLLLYYEEYQRNQTSNDRIDVPENSTQIPMIEEDSPYNIGNKCFHLSINLIWILLIIFI